MGLLLEGKWHTDGFETQPGSGKATGENTQFRHWVTVNGDAGPSGKAGFIAEPNRYHLYVSLACPAAQQTLIFRALKGFEDIISISVVNPLMGDEGWTFKSGNGVIVDHVNNKTQLHEIYSLALADYTGPATVPVLWDKQQNTIVSNDAADIVRMFNSAFKKVGGTHIDLYPVDKRREIDADNKVIDHHFINEVYRAGFASSQGAYQKAINHVFDCLQQFEQRLTTQRYLTGSQPTEADWRLFTTLLRFDPVYVGLFKCNQKRIIDYPALSNYLRDLYQHPGIADTVDIDGIKAHYYTIYERINPTRIIPIGPKLDHGQPHNRACDNTFSTEILS